MTTAKTLANLSIPLPAGIGRRLDALASRTGRDKEGLASEAICRQIDALEREAASDDKALRRLADAIKESRLGHSRAALLMGLRARALTHLLRGRTRRNYTDRQLASFVRRLKEAR